MDLKTEIFFLLSLHVISEIRIFYFLLVSNLSRNFPFHGLTFQTYERSYCFGTSATWLHVGNTFAITIKYGTIYHYYVPSKFTDFLFFLTCALPIFFHPSFLIYSFYFQDQYHISLVLRSLPPLSSFSYSPQILKIISWFSLSLWSDASQWLLQVVGIVMHLIFSSCLLWVVIDSLI